MKVRCFEDKKKKRLDVYLSMETASRKMKHAKIVDGVVEFQPSDKEKAKVFSIDYDIAEAFGLALINRVKRIEVPEVQEAELGKYVKVLISDSDEEFFNEGLEAVKRAILDFSDREVKIAELEAERETIDYYMGETKKQNERLLKVVEQYPDAIQMKEIDETFWPAFQDRFVNPIYGNSELLFFGEDSIGNPKYCLVQYVDLPYDEDIYFSAGDNGTEETIKATKWARLS